MQTKVYFIKLTLTNLQIITQNKVMKQKLLYHLCVDLTMSRILSCWYHTHKLLFVYMRNSEEVVWVNGGFVEENGMKIARLKT